MNPYSTSTSLPLVNELHGSAFWRWTSFLTSVGTTIILTIVIMLLITDYINETYNPNMGTWAIFYWLITALTCIQTGIVSAYHGKWFRNKKAAYLLIPTLIGITFVVAPWLMIPAMKGAYLPFPLQFVVLFAWTNLGPYCAGVIVYVAVANFGLGRVPTT